MDACKDSQRKERKRGVKRGPYKRKNKSSGMHVHVLIYFFIAVTITEGAEWPAVQSATAPALIPVVSQLGPEGFPVYGPPTLVPVAEGQPPPDGSIPMPYFYPPYPYPGLVAPPPQLDPVLTALKKQKSMAQSEAGSDDESNS